MPSVPKKVNLNRVEELASLGLNQVQIGAALGLSRSTIQRRLGSKDDAFDADFTAAYEKGLSNLLVKASTKLLEAVDAGNLDAIRFTLRCRGNWNPTNPNTVDLKIEGNNKPSLTLVFQTMTPSVLTLV